MWRYVPTVEVCTHCGGMYPLWRYVPTVEVCTQCGGMYPLWRYVPNAVYHYVIDLACLYSVVDLIVILA